MGGWEAVPDLELSLAIGRNPRSSPLLAGQVETEGIVLRCSALHASELFWRQLGFREFDVSEMSMSSLLMAHCAGDTTWVGIPVFTTRRFFHTGVLVREDAGIQQPGDLAGKQVGVPEYQQTAALWTRGILQHEFGLDPKDLTWHMERPPERSHGGALGFKPPPGIRLSYVPSTTNLGEMLAFGQLDAALHYLAATNNLVDRSQRDFRSGSGVRPLFDASAEASRYFAKTGIFPINHCVVVRRDILERHPWVALNLFSAMQEAKSVARRELDAWLEAYRESGLVDAEASAALGRDLYPYGVRRNEEVLTTLTKYSNEQGLTPRQVDLEEIFYPATMEL